MAKDKLDRFFEETGMSSRWVEKGKLDDAKAMYAEGDSLERISRITKIPQDRLVAALDIQVTVAKRR